MRTVMLVLNFLYFLWNVLLIAGYHISWYLDGDQEIWIGALLWMILATIILSMFCFWRRQDAGNRLYLGTAILNFVSIMLYIVASICSDGGGRSPLTIIQIIIHALNLASAYHVMRERGWSVMKTVMLVLNLMYFLWNMIVASIYYADGQYTAWSSIAYLVVFITNLISMHFLWKRHTAGDWLCLVTAVLNFISIMLYIWDLNWTMGGMALLITITKITIHVLNLAFACHTLRERGNE